MAKPKNSKPESVIKPSTEFQGGKEHVLKTLFEGGEDESDLPILKSVGYTKLHSLKSSASFVAYTITSQGTKVLKIEVEEPNQRYIAEDSAKIAFVNNFMGGDDHDRPTQPS